MGSQFKLYLTPNDELTLLHRLQVEWGVLIHRTVYFYEEEKTVSCLKHLGKYPTDAQVGLTAAPFLDSLITTAFPAGHTRLDLVHSPVIEFGRCEMAAATIRPGRIWYQIEGVQGRKSEAFRKWASALFRGAKRCLAARPYPVDCCLGAEAAALVDAGRVALSLS